MLGAPRSALSLIPALALVTFTLGMMVHDRLLAALRFRAFSLLAFGFAGGGHLLFAFDGGYAALLTGYGMLFGLGAGLGYGLALALVTRLPTRVRSLGLGLAMAAFAISGVVLSGLFAQPIRETDPTAGFLIIGLAILAAGSGVTAFLPTQPARPMAVQECARPAAKPRRGVRGPTAAPGQPASPDDRNRWTGAIGSTLQIGSTRCVPRSVSMNDTITSTGGRAPPWQNTRSPCAGSRWLAAARGSRAPGPSASRPSRSGSLCLPLSTSAFLTQSFNVCAEQPIFAAIDMIACQRDGCWASLSRTSRTARPRTSGENLLVVLLMMLHP